MSQSGHQHILPNTEGITYATIGAGDIRVRDYENYNFDALNRDVDNVQVITSETYFAIEIPAINLERWKQQVKETVFLLRAATTNIPDQIRAKGEYAIDLYREYILQGVDPAELRILASGPAFARAAKDREYYFKALEHYGSREAIPEEIVAAVTLGYGILLGEASSFEGGSFTIPCLNSSQTCQVAISDFNDLLKEKGEELLLKSLQDTFGEAYNSGIGLTTNLVLGFKSAGLLATLLYCAKNAPEVFKALIANPEARSILQWAGGFYGTGPDAFLNINAAIIAGETGDVLETTFNGNIRADFRFTTGVENALVGTAEGTLAFAHYLIAGNGLLGIAEKQKVDAAMQEFLDAVYADPLGFGASVYDNLSAIVGALASGDAEAWGGASVGIFAAILTPSQWANLKNAVNFDTKTVEVIDGFVGDLSLIDNMQDVVAATPFASITLESGFSSFSAFKRANGSAGAGQAWHHLVEQTPNAGRFPSGAIHNPDNLIKLPHGPGTIHNQISGFYGSKQDFTGGKTVRQWISQKTYKEQFSFAVQTVIDFGGTQYLPPHLR